MKQHYCGVLNFLDNYSYYVGFHKWAGFLVLHYISMRSSYSRIKLYHYAYSLTVIFHLVMLSHYLQLLCCTNDCACCRHSEEMLQKLRSAGLGFFLKDEEKIPKLGMYHKWIFS